MEIITAAAFALAWLAFRYDRQRRWHAELDAARDVLRSVHHAMVQGLTPGQAVGWGQIYFSTIYTDAVASRRAEETRRAVRERRLDQVLVVPTEPLERLATATPHPGLVEQSTVAVANFALWRVHVFNQLVNALTNFNAANAAEIIDAGTPGGRREALAGAAAGLSYMLHRDGIGEAWAAGPHGADGWYRALVSAVIGNINDLEETQRSARWRWAHEWPLLILDVLVAVGLLAVIVSVVVRAA